MRHDHYFYEEQGYTRMVDDFDYEVPYGIAGKLFDRLYLNAYMRRLLLQRNAYIKAEAEKSSHA